MKWPFVRRAKYELLKRVAESHDATHRAQIAQLREQLDAANKRARRRERRNAEPKRPQPAEAVTAPVEPVVFPPEISKAIRSVAGADRHLARHLRAVAEDRLDAEVPVRQIVSEILRGEEVAP